MWRRIFGRREVHVQPNLPVLENMPTLELDEDGRDDPQDEPARDPDAPAPRDREITRKLRPGGEPVPEIRTYHVRIVYREPSYELRRGRRDRPLDATFMVEASCPEDAQELARRELREESARRYVGWLQEIESIECCECVQR